MNHQTISIDAMAAHMAMQRNLLCNSAHFRRRMIATFPLQVAQVAADLLKMCELREQGAEWSSETEDQAQYLEDLIAARFRYCFGIEIPSSESATPTPEGTP